MTIYEQELISIEYDLKIVETEIETFGPNMEDPLCNHDRQTWQIYSLWKKHRMKLIERATELIILIGEEDGNK